MKIAILSIHNGLVERGAEVFVTEISEEIGKKNTIHIYQSGNKKSNTVPQFFITGIPFVQHQNTTQNRIMSIFLEIVYTFSVLFFSLKCLSYLFKGEYDWIIPINGGFQSVLMRLFRFVRPKTKILITGHAGVGRDDWWNITIGNPNIFVALTSHAYSWGKKISSSIKIVCIPNGINLNKFSDKGKILSFPLHDPIILCVASLIPYKRIELLIRAVSYLQKGSLLVVGEGVIQKDIESIGKNILGPRFLLKSGIAHDQMPSVYRAVKVFSLPSESSEAFGLSYLEALACNIPVVAPDDSNRREIIGNGGIFVHPENIYEYADGLKRALEKNFGSNPRKQAEKFSWEEVGRKYLRILQNT